MKVWLDDLRSMPEGYDVHVTTAMEAIRYLETGKITEISLDHDLGAALDVHTGYFVTKWIEAEAHAGRLPRLKWHLHTQNPVGARDMRMALENADKSWNRQEEKQDGG